MLFKHRVEDKIEEEVLETKLVPQSTEDINIITNEVGGYPWSVKFYNNITEKEDAVSRLDLNLSPAIQSYRYIEDLEIKLESGISDDDISDITGQGWINIGSKIYTHDLFKAKVKGDRLALFEITKVNDRRYENTDLANVTFKVIGFSDTESELFDNLESKIATNYIYNKDFKDSNSSPIVTKQNQMNYTRMVDNIRLLLNRYLNMYLNAQTSTLAVESPRGNVIDPFLNDFFSAVFTSEISSTVTLATVDSFEKRSSSFTIFNVILDQMLLDSVNKLHFSEPDFNPYYRILSRAEYSVKSNYSFSKEINGKHYFISDDFYNDDYVPIDDFETYLLDFIKGENKDISEFEKYLFDMPLDFDGYFRIPIMLYMYKLYALAIRR